MVLRLTRSSRRVVDPFNDPTFAGCPTPGRKIINWWPVLGLFIALAAAVLFYGGIIWLAIEALSWLNRHPRTVGTVLGTVCLSAIAMLAWEDAQRRG